MPFPFDITLNHSHEYVNLSHFSPFTKKNQPGMSTHEKRWGEKYVFKKGVDLSKYG